MYVCLCLGVTSHTMAKVVADGAATSKEVAAACGAGSDCGRCRRTVRAIIAGENRAGASQRDPRRGCKGVVPAGDLRDDVGLTQVEEPRAG